MGPDFFFSAADFSRVGTLMQGVEGVFRASCERSLAVLRANKEALLTVLEVMLHDPLYNWSVGPGKAAAKQAGEWKKLCDEDGGQKNKGNRQVALIHLKVLFCKLVPVSPAVL
jgi:ataxia telangiectasia mutated family protein